MSKKLTDKQKATQNAQEIFKKNRPPDVADPRAKTSGHGKKTADKWNQ